MRRFLFFLALACAGSAGAQSDTTRWLRAFPITDYMVDLNDTVKVVQLEMPEGFALKEKQLGVVFGVYETSRADAVQKGYGRCNLIKGDYYYFTISNNTSGLALKKGDLIYTFMDKTGIYYGRFPKLASHFIRLLDVYEKPFFDRYTIFFNWTQEAEDRLVDSLVADIRFTGKYFKENEPGMDRPITKGSYQGRTTLQTMAECGTGDVRKFLDYMIGNPRLYAGREWKVSEVFGTWLVNGAP